MYTTEPIGVDAVYCILLGVMLIEMLSGRSENSTDWWDEPLMFPVS